ncbi:MAG TPA: glycine cleavage system protein H [Blastocatellia bacterium]|nr:glycine cleavage system protein H [Blastocatellia bacterium]
MMSDHFIFLMGTFEARIPNDRLYVRNHMWFQAQSMGYRVGFTAFAVRLLQDIYFLDWNIEPETAVEANQEIGEIESSKAVSSLYAPATGRLCRFNPALMKDPTPINTDNYGHGWLFDFEPQAADLLSAADYLKYLDRAWEESQRQIKGQMHD